MRITQEADYALRICAALAQAEQPVATPQLSEELCVPPRFTSKILRKLMLCELVNSIRGVNGGFTLKVNPSNLTLYQVIEAIDGEIAIRHCLICEHKCNYQEKKENCRFHCVFDELNHIIKSRLNSITIWDIIDKDIPINKLTERLHN